MKRKYYIDNLRWFCILLLVPFHCAMAWNSWGEGNYIKFGSNNWLSSFIIMISPWYMTLLFVLAGISARYSLQKRSYSQFLLERVKKLLIPLITGIFTVVAAMTYYADRFNCGYQGSFFTHYGVFFTKFTDFSGYDGGWTPAHLWFMLFLFGVSILSILVIALQRKIFPNFSLKSIKAGWIPFLILFPAALFPVLSIGDKSFGYYTALFLLGFYVLYEDEVMYKIVKYRVVWLVIMLIVDVADTYMYVWMTDANEILNLITMFFTCWFGILAILGFAKDFFNQHNKIFDALSADCFGFYMFHFIWLIIFQFYISKVTNNIFIMFIVPVIGTYIMTFLTLKIVKMIPIVNFLYGLKKK